MDKFAGERLDGVQIKMPIKEENKDYLPRDKIK
jgi:hypothetical protein